MIWVYHRLTIKGHLDCFQVLAIWKKLLWTFVYNFGVNINFHFSGIICPINCWVILAHFRFKINCQAVFQGGCTILNFPPMPWLSMAQLFGHRSAKWKRRLLVRFHSGHMPGLRVQSLLRVCVWEATDQCFSFSSMFISLSFFLPCPLSKNK